MIKQLSLFFVLASTGFSFVSIAQQSDSSLHTKKDLVVKPFKAEYTLLRKSDAVGTGSRELVKNSDDSYLFKYHTDIEWFIFSDTRNEQSNLTINNGTVVPQAYEYTREGTGKDRHYKWHYQVNDKQATDVLKKRTLEIDFPENIQDKLSYHLQHRINLLKNPQQKHFVYPVLGTSGSIKNYVYQYDGEEDLMLPYGLVKAVRLKREVVEKKRITYAWFAPELDYLMVKLYQVKSGVEQFEAQLNKVTFSD